MKGNPKIGILFGAGAEVNFKLSGGGAFAKKVLGINEEEMNAALKDYYEVKEKKLNEWYSCYRQYKWDKKRLLHSALL